MTKSVTESTTSVSILMALIASFQQWRQERRQRQQRNEEKSREDEYLMPQKYADGLLLPITGDYVVPHYVNGIAVCETDTGHQVMVSTSAREYIIPCVSADQAETVRRNVAMAGHLLYQSGGY